MKITPRQFSQYFAEKGASENCPFCGKDDWSVPSSGGTPVNSPDEALDVSVTNIPLAHNMPGIHRFGQAIQSIALTCVNCGFIRHQHYWLIAEWLQMNGGEK